MKKLIVLFSLLSAFSVAFAAEKAATKSGGDLNEAGSDSCGLGWQVTRSKTFLATTTRGTTNSFVPPTFGMTSGTIGCSQHDFAKNEENAARYAVNNSEALSIEMAQGQGEILAGFARTMGCSDAVIPAFGQTMQENYGAVAGQQGIELFKSVKSRILSNAVLAASCGV